MDEAVMYGVAVSLLMLGVPLWHSMGECRKGRPVRMHLCRWWLLCGFMVMFSFTVAVLFGMAGFVIRNSSPPRAPRLPAACKILSKDVDIRAARVCDVGHTTHISKTRKSSDFPPKFRCFLDYYWTSVFKVEYAPHGSRIIVLAIAESPSEALPSECRPNFGIVWRTKEYYQINGTYPCTYSPKNTKSVIIGSDMAGNCNTSEPSSGYLIRQFWYRLIHSEDSILSPSGKTGELFSRAAAAVGLGICYSMIVTVITRIARHMHFRFDNGEYSDLDVVYFEARIQLAILFTASLSGLTWMSNHFLDDAVDIEALTRDLFQRTKHVF